MKFQKFVVLILFVLLFIDLFSQHQQPASAWPSVHRETKPWSRWWWHGSAVTKEGITAEMDAYKKAGLGGLEITPIYGVQGTEKQFVNYLSADWIELLLHTLKEAERLDMGIDMATGTGWPFGGPWVTEADACKNLEFKTYNVMAGQRLKEKIVCIQQPYLRAVGNQIYEVHDSTIASERAKGTVKEPPVFKREEIQISQLIEPISANKNLQALALDQVKFEKPLPLQTLMAFSESGKIVDLTNKVNNNGELDWVAPGEHWKLYAVFAGWHGKMVERAGPGGEGNVIDHFSGEALKNYLMHFDTAFQGHNIKSLRAFFNDSYEVDDARGTADWTPRLFEEFKTRRGYDLKEHLPALFGQAASDKNSRVLSDYRETISELVLENFTSQWKKWAHKNNAVVRNQAHGSPANILDLYATVDIPEIEGVEPLRIKMASSAGNVTGKKLVSSESATWLNEHFESNLADIKKAVDRFLLNGVNHIFYHGTAYSPPDEPWPGWLFYASVHLNPRNSLWGHFSTLNKYVERTQSLLQNATPDNDILLYYPIYDRFATRGPEMIEHFDGVGAQFEKTVFKSVAETMLTQGYTFDYISDKQISATKVQGQNLVTEGNTIYKTIVLPQCKYIPLNTFSKLLSLAEDGATVMMIGGLPDDISGYNNLEEKRKIFNELKAKLKTTHELGETVYGKGKVVFGTDLEKLLLKANIRKEALVQRGLQFLRKNTLNNTGLYFISNNDNAFEGWIALEKQGKDINLYNPMTGAVGIGRSRNSNGKFEVFLQLKPHETIFVEIADKQITVGAYPYVKIVGEPLTIKGDWTLRATDGGPSLPPTIKISSLRSWTELNNPAYKVYSGCGSYSVKFSKPKKKTGAWLLDLGDVAESAEVFINGKGVGSLIGPSFQVMVSDSILNQENELEIKVCNGMANRIIDLDQRHVFWKKFYNINFPARKAENRKNNLFDASHWQARPAGLMGPVKLWALE